MKRQIPVIGIIGVMLFVAMIATVVAGYGVAPVEESVHGGSGNYQHTRVSNNYSIENDMMMARYETGPVEQSPLQIQTATPVSPDVLSNAQEFDELLVNIYERVNPSVVNIEVVQFESSIAFDSSGSGFVIDHEGHIATNSHVVRSAEQIFVTFFDGYVTEASLVGVDDYSDLAVIKVEVPADRLVPVETGNSSDLRIGQHVVAIGNPFGLLSSMTVGIVSATGRVLPSAGLLDSDNADQRFNNPSIIQVDATINPGNSGGPVLDLNGRLIGVATAIRTETGGFQGIAFAVPVNTYRQVIPQLIEKGRADYTWLGITSSGVYNVSQLAETFSLPINYGVLIDTVFDGTAADEAGLRGASYEEVYRNIQIGLGGDIIIAIDSQPVRNLDELLGYLVENTTPGDVVVLTVVRDDQTLEVPVTLQARPR